MCVYGQPHLLQSIEHLLFTSPTEDVRKSCTRFCTLHTVYCLASAAFVQEATIEDIILTHCRVQAMIHHYIDPIHIGLTTVHS